MTTIIRAALLAVLLAGTAGPVLAECAPYISCDAGLACSGELVGDEHIATFPLPVGLGLPVPLRLAICHLDFCIYVIDGPSGTMSVFDAQMTCSRH